jgi:hypothetical protein
MSEAAVAWPGQEEGEQQTWPGQEESNSAIPDWPGKLEFNPPNESNQRDPNGWYIEPGSLPDRIITWFGGGEKAVKEAAANMATVKPGERPPGALPIAKGIDAATGVLGVPPVLTDLVETTSREPVQGETSFTNFGLPQFGPQEGTAKQIAAGVANVPIGFANFLLSPGGIATMHGVGLLPKLAQTLVGLGFTAQQAWDFINAKTLQDRVTSGVGTILLGAGTAAGAKLQKSDHSTSQPPPVAPKPGEGGSTTQPKGGEQPYAKPNQQSTIDFVPVEEWPGRQEVPSETARFQGEAAQGAQQPPGPGAQQEPALPDRSGAQGGARQDRPAPGERYGAAEEGSQGGPPPGGQSPGNIPLAESAAGLPPDRAAAGGLTDAGTSQSFKSFAELPAVENGGSRIDEGGASSTPDPEAVIWREQEKVPFGFGPGAASADEIFTAASQIRQLNDTVTASLKTKRPVSIAQRMTRVTGKIGGKVITARESLGRAADTARAAWLTVKNGYLRPSLFTGPKEVVKDWDFADQRSGYEARQFALKLRHSVDPLTDRAMTYWIQAGGDVALLRQRANASNIKYRPAYEAALDLTPEQRTFALNAGQYFEAMLQDGVSSGLLDHGLDNYVNQIWNRPNKFTQKLQADLQNGKLQTSFQFARKRIFDSYFDGEQAGHAPADTRLSTLIPIYDLAFRKSLNARAMIKGLRAAEMPDGAPAVKFSGMTQPIAARLADGTPNPELPPEAYLIRSGAMPEGAVARDGRSYVHVDHPALRGWKLALDNKEGPPTYHQVDMLVHPDFAPQLKNMLGRSWFRQNPVTSTMLKAGAIAKQTKLSLSIFHLDQEGLHGLFHRVNPANLERINFEDPAQALLIRNGLVVSNFEAMELFSEGLRGGGLVGKIPVLGEIQNRFNEFLFKDYIPRLKMTMALHAFERNAKRYPTLSPDVLAELTARQGNAAFGELNYRQMARSPHLQDFLRLTVLAPDFLEARSRFVGQALKPYGREQQVALFLGGATMYVACRALNQWLDNDPHWDKPFSVIYNEREYRLRTVMGDAAEVFLDPRRFLYNRFSPWLKTGVTVQTGRDYRGIKLNNWEQVKDTLSWFVPMPLGHQENANLVQRALGTAGVSNKPADTPVQQVYQAALKFKEGLTDPKVQAELERAWQETYAQSDYAKLNRAILDHDNEGAVAAIVELLSHGKDVATQEKFYSNLPNKPFTGSRSLEDQFMGRMTPVERARYQSAVAQRINMSRAFFTLLPLALRQRKK